ncbi:MAG: NlpC/P60 family protein [Spirochaetales bacterium]|nr:MAG: NlpC/P60 family protein [Spirochaetales bacterium]
MNYRNGNKGFRISPNTANDRIATVFLLLLAACSTVYGQDSDTQTRERILSIALGFRGVPYKYGAESPAAFDCSGFVRYVYRKAAGLELPRSARSYMAAGRAVDVKNARPGDVFVFDTVGGTASHVALYAGDGKLIHAVSEGPKTGVIVSDLPDRYWSPRLIAVRSFLNPAVSAPAPTVPTTAAGSSDTGTGMSSPTPPGSTATASRDEIIADIGIGIPVMRMAIEDPIPSVLGTSLAFTLTNDTGKSGDFIVQYYVIDAKTFALSELYKQKVRLASGASFGLPAYRFEKPGKYRIVVKGEWGSILVERTFLVEATSK